MYMKLDAQQLRYGEYDMIIDTSKQVERNPITVVLDYVYDTYNIGGLFRLADALAAEKMYICGEDVETPPNTKIKRSSIGTYQVVPWEWKSSAIDAIAEVRGTCASHDKKVCVVAVEQDVRAVDYLSVPYASYDHVVLVVGNETHGVSADGLDVVDTIVEIPMGGVNKSLNVIVSGAVVGYEVFKRLKTER